MAFHCLKLLRITRNIIAAPRGLISSSISTLERNKFNINKDKPEYNLLYLEDPDTFGTLSTKNKFQRPEIEDEGDVKEKEYQETAPLASQKLTTKQYADLIKEYLKYRRLKEAIDVLEVRMLIEDRVKPENYIYNILIGACADVGYTKKAFMLFNEMKRRSLKPTGDTYTCLFHACANSPWPLTDGLKRAHNLKSLLVEKGIEPNLTNYNAMIKAFGRCGDLPTAFKLVDEMINKNIKVRVHTFNHLLHGCITDKDTGLRHALIVWRKMLKMREKPNLYSFNLMLKCVKECNLGNKADIEELIDIIQQQMLLDDKSRYKKSSLIQAQDQNYIEEPSNPQPLDSSVHIPLDDGFQDHTKNKFVQSDIYETVPNEIKKANANIDVAITHKSDNISITFVENSSKPVPFAQMRTVPNLLSKVINMDHVFTLQAVDNPQDKFAVVGGQEDFLKEMNVYSVKPDIKTFTQMLPLIEDTRDAESKLLETMKKVDIKADIDFYNMLIKKRCLRSDYDGAFEVKDIIEADDKYRRKKHPLKKKFRLKLNVMTYGTLALACRSKESAEKLLGEMKEKQLKVNIQILGTLLRHGTTHIQFGYVFYIMNFVKNENIKPNDVFLKHLEAFNDKCLAIIQDEKMTSEKLVKGYKNFSYAYNNWLKEVNVEEALQTEHPWTQFRETYPQTVQRQNVTIKEPKRFSKKRKSFPLYKPK